MILFFVPHGQKVSWFILFGSIGINQPNQPNNQPNNNSNDSKHIGLPDLQDMVGLFQQITKCLF